MLLDKEEIRQIIRDRDAMLPNKTWRIYKGSNMATAPALLNDDDSIPYLREIGLDSKMLAMDGALTVNTEIYRLTLVTDDEPENNAAYWISFDEGTTRERIDLSYYQAKNDRAYWWLFFKKE